MSSILPLKLNGVTVKKRGKTILDAINSELTEHGFSIVLGPNGAGKTTFLRTLHGLERLNAGQLNWNIAEAEARNAQTFVFQAPIMMRRTVLQNISYPLITRGLQPKEAETRAEDWAEKVGITQQISMEATNLSGGERQKLAIARALVVEPELLFLDEPTTNLDGSSTKEIEAILMMAYKNGTRIIMTTHDLGQAKRLATDIIFLHNGKLCEQSDAATFFEHADSAPARAYLNGDIVE